MTPSRLLCLVAAAAVVTIAPLAASPALHAQDAYPTGTVKLVVGFAPGGGNDILARIVADKLQQHYGKPFIVDNRPGANGLLAIDAVKRSPPDGSTLLVGPSSAMTVNPIVLKTVPYDPVTDFVPIAMVGIFPLIVAVHPSFPAQSLKELIAVAKARPGSINYSSASSSFQLATEMFAQQAGVKLQNIPYRGSAPAVAAVIANDVSLTFGDVATILPFIQNGQLRALAVTTAARIPSLPDIPTVAEAALPGFEMVIWSALFAPVGTPAWITAQLEQDVARIVAMPDIAERLKTLGVERAGFSGAQLLARISKELAAFRTVADAAGMKPAD
jgi:tripartite-type tricarboxylate transporter receptor subunit TctC